MKVLPNPPGRYRLGRVRCAVFWGLASGIAALLLMSLFSGCSNDCICNCGDTGDNGGGGNDTTGVIRHVQDFLPQEAGGMTRSGDPQTASTATELENIINGGYLTYDNHNFQEFVEQEYQGSVGGEQATLRAWIFEMATVLDAKELHDDPEVDTGSCEVLDELGDQQRLCRSFLWQIMQIQRDMYWIKLEIDNDSEDALAILGLFGTHIDQEILSQE